MDESLTSEQVRICVAAAVRAPSLHNTQPWMFQPDGDRVHVYADLRRRLPAVDPQGRGLYLSVGAAILNLRLAMAAVGRPAGVQRLLPDPANPWHVATIVAGPHRTASAREAALYAAIPERRTSRRPFTGRPATRGELDLLEAAALRQGCLLQFTDGYEREAVIGLIRTADDRERDDPAYRTELRSWVTDDPYRDDGVPLEAVGPRSREGALPVRDFGLDRELPGRTVEDFGDGADVGILSAIGGDGPANWLRGGQGLQSVLLEATRRGLSTGLFTQPIEQPDLRDLLTDPTGRTSAEAIVRVGHADAPTVETPRRPVPDVLLASGRRRGHGLVDMAG